MFITMVILQSGISMWEDVSITQDKEKMGVVSNIIFNVLVTLFDH